MDVGIFQIAFDTHELGQLRPPLVQEVHGDHLEPGTPLEILVIEHLRQLVLRHVSQLGNLIVVALAINIFLCEQDVVDCSSERQNKQKQRNQ